MHGFNLFNGMWNISNKFSILDILEQHLVHCFGPDMSKNSLSLSEFRILKLWTFKVNCKHKTHTQPKNTITFICTKFNSSSLSSKALRFSVLLSLLFRLMAFYCSSQASHNHLHLHTEKNIEISIKQFHKMNRLVFTICSQPTIPLTTSKVVTFHYKFRILTPTPTATVGMEHPNLNFMHGFAFELFFFVWASFSWLPFVGPLFYSFSHRQSHRIQIGRAIQSYKRVIWIKVKSRDIVFLFFSPNCYWDRLSICWNRHFRWFHIKLHGHMIGIISRMSRLNWNLTKMPHDLVFHYGTSCYVILRV